MAKKVTNCKFMKLYDRLLAEWVWLQKFTIFSPLNLAEDSELKGVEQWGNYAIGYNVYPNLFNIFVQYSPVAETLVNKKVAWAFGNIPSDVKTISTTFESSFTNTVQTLINNAGYDAMLYKGSFAIWVGYDPKSKKINEYKALCLENVRYIERDIDMYPCTKHKHMLTILNEDGKPSQIFYPYDPREVATQIETHGDEFGGQILFYNTAKNSTYPDCIFNSMLPVLLSDAGIDTAVLSLLGNADLLKTYIKKYGNTGANSVNEIIGNQNISSMWGIDGRVNLGGTASVENGSDYFTTGVKGTGTVEYLNIETEESVANYVKTSDFPKFMDETVKLDERIGRRVCLALGIPYELVFKMDTGLLNQDNRRILIGELNNLLENDRETFERVLNNILENSVYDYRIQIKAIGEDKENVREATENITNE